MSVSVIVATYGDPEWEEMALVAALSADKQDECDLIVYHDPYGDVTVRNDAAVDAKGDWLCFLDADDELAPGYIGAMERALEREGALTSLLLTPAVQIVRQGRLTSQPHFFREVPLRQANWLVVGTLIHKDLFWEVGGFPDYPHGLEDWALWSKCVRVGAQVVKVPGAVYRYHANPHSMHRQLWRDKKNQRAEHMRVARELDEWEATWVST